MVVAEPRKLKPGDVVKSRPLRASYGQTEIAGLTNDKSQTYRMLGTCKLPALGAHHDAGESR
jgi:hypothetical protein